MYGNGNFHLPIIDIVQTINSTSHAYRKSKLSKPIITSSSKGVFGLRGESDSVKRVDAFCDRKSVSYNFLPKKFILREEEEANDQKNLSTSKLKILKIRKNPPQPGNKLLSCNCNRDGQHLGENKSLRVLFRAEKTSSLFDNEGFDEEEFDFSFLKGSVVSSADLKRKGSFVDYIRMKRKRNDSTELDSDESNR